MDFEKTKVFLDKHWTAMALAAVVASPIIWYIASTHFKERITNLEIKVESLSSDIKGMESDIAVLKEYKERSVVLKPKKVGFDSEALYTPSTPEFIEE